MSDASIDAARALLPAWVGWSNLALLPAMVAVAAASTWLVTRLATRLLRRTAGIDSMAPDQRAALVGPVRAAVRDFRWKAALMLPLFTLPLSDDLTFLTTEWVALIGAAAIVWVTGAASAPLRRFTPAARFSAVERRRVTLFFAVGHAPVALIVTLAIAIDPSRPLASTLLTLIGIVAGLAMSDRARLALFRRAGITRPPPPNLVAAVADAARECGVAPPHLLEADLPVANSLALPSKHTLVVTRRCVELWNPLQLTAFCAHQLREFTPRHRTRASVFVAALSLLSIVFMRPLAHWIGALSTLLVIAVLVLGMRWLERVGKRRAPGDAEPPASGVEREADAYEQALALRDRDAEIVRPPRKGTVAAHPSPSRRSLLLAKLAGSLVLAPCVLAPVYFAMVTAILPYAMLPWPRDLSLALGQGTSGELFARFQAAAEAGDEAGADVLVAAAAALASRDESNGWFDLMVRFGVVKVIPFDPETPDSPGER